MTIIYYSLNSYIYATNELTGHPSRDTRYFTFVEGYIATSIVVVTVIV